MPTPKEIGMVHVAANQAGLNDAQYRAVLRNVGAVASSKALTQAGLEDCMAVFEDAGFRHRGQPADFWRSKVQLRGAYCGARMEFRIKELAAQQKYDLAGLCRRFSKDRVARVDKLLPQEAHGLIEALKAIVARAPAAGGSAGGGAASQRTLNGPAEAASVPAGRPAAAESTSEASALPAGLERI
jgi:hypothetical protein